MTDKPSHSETTNRARALRQSQTQSEGLLWSILRAKQLCGLKFRRQHPIGPWIADFACVDRKLVVEIDGGCHDETIEEDLCRQEGLQQRGWAVIRFSAEDLEDDAESVGRAIAHTLGIPYEFKRRVATGSGMRNVRVAERTPLHRPSPVASRPTLPEGG